MQKVLFIFLTVASITTLTLEGRDKIDPKDRSERGGKTTDYRKAGPVSREQSRDSHGRRPHSHY